MRIAIVPNDKRDINLEQTKRLAGELKGLALLCADELYRGCFSADEFYDGDKLYDECDIVITLGGDGTLLAAAQKAAPRGKPILGINLGRLGFLTGSEKEYFFREGIKRLKDDLKIEERMMITAMIRRANGVTEEFIALNEIAVTRSSFSKIGRWRVDIGSDTLGEYLADGVMVSTPTGSTAYSLSAGGPIVDKEMQAVIIIPLCPHMLHARPVVIPAEKTVKICNVDKETYEFDVTLDGHNGCVLAVGDTVKVKKADFCTKLIRLDDMSFYDLLREKLNYQL